MTRFTFVDWIAMVLVIIGGLNWGAIGISGFDMIAAVFGDMTIASRFIYVLIGIAAVYLAAILVNLVRYVRQHTPGRAAR